MIPASLTIPEELRALLGRSLPGIIEESGESPEVALRRMLVIGFNECLKADIRRLDAKLEILRRHDEVEGVISRMTKEQHVADDELDLVCRAAKAGHVEAGYLVSDFKRFGRSMKRREAK